MKQYILSEDWDGSDTIILTGKEHHYLTRVLRYPRGTCFPGRDRLGRALSLTLERVDGQSCMLRVDPGKNTTRKAEIPIILYPSLLKGKNTDLVIRQATEAGVSRIQPVISRNTIRKGEEGDDDRKAERWKKIAREAAQQCGNPGIPEILPTVLLSRMNLSLFKNSTSLFFHEKTLENKPLHEYLSQIAGEVSLFFGPEGGFSPEEVDNFLSAGFLPVYLGDNVLRAETAVVYGTGAVQTILRECDSWERKK